MKIPPIFFCTSCNSDIYKKETKDGTFLIKIFDATREEVEEKIKVSKLLLDVNYDGTHALPRKIARIDKQEKGYGCYYYPDAISFHDEK